MIGTKETLVLENIYYMANHNFVNFEIHLWTTQQNPSVQEMLAHLKMINVTQPPDRVHPVHALHRQRQLDGLGPRQRHQLHHQVERQKDTLPTTNGMTWSFEKLNLKCFLKSLGYKPLRAKQGAELYLILQHGASRHRPVRLPPACRPDYTNLWGDLVGHW